MKQKQTINPVSTGSSSARIVANMLWRFAERCGAQGVTFLVSLVLARLLSPNDYGTIALVMVIITFLNVFVDSGMGNALIQKKDADDLDFSTVFFFNLGMCLLIYLLVFFAAPWVAAFYHRPELTTILRVLSIMIVLSGIKNVQQAYVSRNMLFKRFFFSTLGGTIGAAVIGISMALLGFGVWALVAQQLFNTLMDTAILWFTVAWRPRKMFSWKRWKVLFKYGWKLFVSSLIDTFYNNIRQLLIGKLYSSADLAFYNQGKQFPNQVVLNINSSIDSVLFPAMAHVQNDVAAVKHMCKRAIKMSTYLMAPIMIGMGVCADSLVLIILGEKWLSCVPYFRIFCITCLLYPIQTANLQALKAIGKSGIFLQLEIVKNVIGLLLLFVSMRWGVMAIAYSLLVSTVIASFINAYPNKQLLHYSYLEQVKDIFPNLFCALLMGAMVYTLGYLTLPRFITLIIQVISGILLYAILSILFKLESYQQVKGLFHKLTRREVSS